MQGIIQFSEVCFPGKMLLRCLPPPPPGARFVQSTASLPLQALLLAAVVPRTQPQSGLPVLTSQSPLHPLALITLYLNN